MIEVEAAKSRAVFSYWGDGFSDFAFYAWVPRGVYLGDESAFLVRDHDLSLLRFVVRVELSELQEVVRWHRF